MSHESCCSIVLIILLLSFDELSLLQVAKAMHRRQRADLGGGDKAQEDADIEAAIAASLQSTPAVASPLKRPRTTAVGPAEVVNLAADSDDDEVDQTMLSFTSDCVAIHL